MARTSKQATCHPDRPNCAFGMCQPCYMRSRRTAPLGENEARATCHPDRRNWSNGLCESCYRKQWTEQDPNRDQRLAARRKKGKEQYAAWRSLNPIGSRPDVVRVVQVKKQSVCHPEKKEYSRGLCRACYMRDRRNTAGGKTSPTCHPERRHYAQGLCHACYQSWRRNSDPAKAEASRESSRKHREAIRSDPEKHEAFKAVQREAGRRYSYAITGEEYEAALVKQNRCCAICGNAFSDVAQGNPPCIDHCHEQDVFRGLLCRSCNLLLGYAKDSVEILAAAIRYLEAFALRQREAAG
jgi:hypothetical protein